MSISVSLVAKPIFTIAGVTITNSMLSAFAVTVGITIFALLVSRKFSFIPRTRLQVAFEAAAEAMEDQLVGVLNSREKARKFFPLLFTLIIFIILANQFTVFPLVAQILYQGEAFFRTPTADLSLTIALALLMIGMCHVIALSVSPLKHIGSFIRVAPFVQARSLGDIGNAFLGLFLGLLDIVGEIAKVLSLSFRLFGNVFAGEAIIAVIGGLSLYTSALVPIPFMVLSIFSGFVQAAVFTLLSMQFLAGVVASQEE